MTSMMLRRAKGSCTPTLFRRGMSWNATGVIMVSLIVCWDMVAVSVVMAIYLFRSRRTENMPGRYLSFLDWIDMFPAFPVMAGKVSLIVRRRMLFE